MAISSTGVGRGNGSGGKRPGAGRPVGAINKRTGAVIDQAEREGKQLPLDFMLDVMRDSALPLQARMAAAATAMPFCHARLTALRVFPDPKTMDDATLMVQVAHLEQRAAEMPESERAEAVSAQFEHLLEDLPRLAADHQEMLLRRLAEAAEAGLRQMNGQDHPGTVPSRQNGSANGSAAVVPVAAADRVFDYDRATGQLKRVS